MLSLLITYQKEAHAQSVADSYDPIANDITYIPADESGKGKGFIVSRLVSYTIGTSGVYIYNDGGGTGSTAGAIKMRGKSRKSVQINITNMKEEGTNTVTIEVANGTTTPALWGTAAEFNYTGTATDAFVVTEEHDFIRYGAKRTGDNSADFTIIESYSE